MFTSFNFRNSALLLTGILVVATPLLASALEADPQSAQQPTIKELLAAGKVTRSVIKPTNRAKDTLGNSTLRHSQTGELISMKTIGAETVSAAGSRDTTIIRKLETSGRQTKDTKFGKGVSFTDFIIPLEWFSTASAYPSYTEPLFTQYVSGGHIVGLGIYSDGNNQYGYWSSDFVELADAVAGVAGNADLDLIVEVEGFDQIGSPFNNIKFYPSFRTRLNVYGFSNAALYPAGPSTMAGSSDLALPFDGETMFKADISTAHAYNGNYIIFNGFNTYADDVYTVSFDFLDFGDTDKYVEYIVRSVKIRAYWYR